MMRVDFTASFVTNNAGLRSRIERIAADYNPACENYFGSILCKHEESFTNSACGFILLDSLLQKNKINRSELVFYIDENGRPQTNRDDLDFSISHSEGCALCALAVGDGANVGIDVQRVRNYSFEKMCKLADVFMNEDELLEFKKQTIEFDAESFVHRQEVFFSAWSRREAYVKRVGLDIFDNLKNVDLSSEFFREGVIRACGELYCYAVCSMAYKPEPNLENKFCT